MRNLLHREASYLNMRPRCEVRSRRQRMRRA
jgi:hypothetical protein